MKALAQQFEEEEVDQIEEENDDQESPLINWCNYIKYETERIQEHLALDNPMDKIDKIDYGPPLEVKWQVHIISNDQNCKKKKK